MKYTLTQQKGSVKIDFKLDAAEWAKAMDDAFQRTKGKFSVPGFRKGKAPKSVIFKMYGEGAFFDDAFNEVFPNCYSEVLDKETQIIPVDRPSVNLSDINDNGIEFYAIVTVRPDVKLGAYTGLKLAKVEYTAKPEDVDAEIARARDRVARKVEVTDRAAAIGDTVNIDYSGSVDGVKFDGGTAEQQDLELGSNMFIPGFEDQVVGMEVGASKDIKVTFPQDYQAEALAGKEAVFAVTVHKITAKELPMLDDEFAKDVSKFETFAEYKQDIVQRLSDAAKRKADNENENTVLKAVADGTEVEIPDCMIDEHLDNLIKDFEYRLMYQGMKLEDYYKYTHTTEDDLRRARRDEAAAGVKTRLTVEEIIKAEKIEPTQADLDQKIEAMAKTADKSVEEFKQTMDERRYDYMRNEIVMDKVMDVLMSRNEWTVSQTDAKEPAKKPAAKKTTAKKAAE